MGNDLGKGSRNMYIAAMANVTSFEKKELQALNTKFMELAKTEGNPNTITRHEFQEALSFVGIQESDQEILDRLFTMFDKMGDNQINFREFIVGISPLAKGTVQDKLHFSFQLYDIDQTQQIKQAEMIFVLTAMNNVSSWFGDAAMTQEQIEKLVDEARRQRRDDRGRSHEAVLASPAKPSSHGVPRARPKPQIFEEADVSGTGSLSYAEYMTAVVNHPILVQFVTGGGTVRA